MKKSIILTLFVFSILWAQKQNQGNLEYELKIDFISYAKNAARDNINTSYFPAINMGFLFNQKALHYFMGLSYAQFNSSVLREDQYTITSYEYGPTYSVENTANIEEINRLSRKNTAIRLKFGAGVNFLPQYKHLDIVLGIGIQPSIYFKSKTTDSFNSRTSVSNNNFTYQSTYEYSENYEEDNSKVDIYTDVRHQTGSGNKFFSFLSPTASLQINPKIKRFTIITEFGYRYYRSAAYYINQFNKKDLTNHHQGFYFSIGFRYNITNRTYF